MTLNVQKYRFLILFAILVTSAGFAVASPILPPPPPTPGIAV